VDSHPAADQPPVVALLARPMQKARVPRKRYDDGPAINEVNGKRVVSHRDIKRP